MNAHIIDRYIAKQVLMSTAVVLLVVMSLDGIFAVVDELNRLKGNYQVWQAVQFIGLQMPKKMYNYLPLSCLVGCIAGLGGLAASSELTVIRAAGVPVRRIAWSVMQPMLVLMMFNLVLAQFVVPKAEPYAQYFKAVAKGNGKVRTDFGQGHWHREGQDFMRFSAIDQQGDLHGITIYSLNEQRELKRVQRASKATYDKGQWRLLDVDSHSIGRTQIHATHYESTPWALELTPKSLSLVTTEPDDLSITDLNDYTSYLVRQGLNANHYLLSFWRKVLQPFSTMALVLLGMSFIFGPLRSVTASYRIFSGIMVGLAYRYTEDLLAPASIVVGFAPIWASLVPIIIAVVAAFYWMRRSG